MSDDVSKIVGEKLKQGGLASRVQARFVPVGGIDEPVGERFFEDSAAWVIGRVVLAFSRFEQNLAFFLEAMATPENGAEINRLFRGSLGARIDGVHGLISSCDKVSPPCIAEFVDWKLRMDGVRLLRNRFIHGRWGVYVYTEQVVSASSYRANAPANDEVRYSLSELEAELVKIEEVCAAFSAWRRRWSI